MKASASSRLVTVCKRLTTSASESGHNRLTFLSGSGHMVDGHERSMARPRCAPSCRSGDGRGVESHV